jgi:DNA-binding NtrC family response regulator
MSIALPPVLVVDDEKNMRLSLKTILAGADYPVRTIESAEEGLALLEKEEILMVISDARLGGMTGYEFLAQVGKRWPHLPVLMITAYATPKLAVEAIKAGAIDYLAKPFAPEELLHAVARCAERYRLLKENASLRARATETYEIDQIIGESPKMREMRELIRTVAPTDATVLIVGESGTGKELIAGSLHSMSHRRDNAYCRINCAAIPETLLESELFGHEKGSFTGAVKQKLGRFEEADGGTVFLDEIGEMSRALQAKLLRFLEDGTFTRVGGNEELRVNVRLIAATNRDIIRDIRQNQFREDLYHRLNVVQFHPPPLRERAGDVVLLADHFLQYFNAVMKKHLRGFSAPAREKLLSHHWPGNVRELRNVIERAVIFESAPEIQAGSLPDFKFEGRLRKEDAAAQPPPAAPLGSLDDQMAQFERQLIARTLEQNQYNLSRCAEQLKISRHALRYRMQRLNITEKTDHAEPSVVSSGEEISS